MNRIAKFALAASLGALGLGSASAHHLNLSGLQAATHYPGAPHAVPDDKSQSPYPMSYSDEAAQTLGVRNGRVDLFSNGKTGDDLAPAVTGGIDRSGAMFKLQWHP